MKNPVTLAVLSLLMIFSSCSKDGLELSSKDYSGESGLNSGNNSQAQAGLVTAGEWNDLNNWEFWGNLLNNQEFSNMPAYWGIFTNNRIAVAVQNQGIPAINAKVELLRNESVIWSARTDNLGYAELWISTFQKEDAVDLSSLTLKINNILQNQGLVLFENGTNQFNINGVSDQTNRVEISFIVDATGSMGDELEFLKEDLKSVIDSVKLDDSNLAIYTSTVFYRDEGDAYVVRKSEFTNDLNKTIDFIKKQKADGGGDFPEAVHTALNAAINELQWSEVAKTRIAFLVLDAPPHYTPAILNSIHNSIKQAAQKGIKVIPITASGIDKETEFLMRFMAILTNGTYVFITNDSGIGNDHLEASVGEYQVEQLNSLMIRLIKKYSE
ncbi:MAG: vWA domain-containing protein [Paludibacter sp.]|nr:vWA domain-containing protein [Paludibacter sp.]